ncbi:MAG: DUF1684 domain-containing protein [Bacteroidota bacterium]
MQNHKNIRFFFFSILILIAANSIAQKSKSFQTDMNEWKQKRISALKAPNGWLNLTGLFWLKSGKNGFGSDASNELVYKHADMPKQAGYFILENHQVNWVTAENIKTTIKDSLVTKALLFEEDEQFAPLMGLGSLRWNIIQRDDKIGIRLRDLNAPVLKTFKGCERYKDDSSWRLTARFEKKAENTLLITNVLGQTNAQASPGKLIFSIAGKEYQLDALGEGDQLFILFGDATSGKGTYPAGRFLYTDLPDANGNTIIDFNKAFNPPCAFTIYATCPLPPKQNILPIAITAGEKDHHGGRR